MTYNWLNVILGIWLIFSSIVPSLLSLWNILIVGILVFIFALIPTFQKK
jgi:hypothetical protein